MHFFSLLCSMLLLKGCYAERPWNDKSSKRRYWMSQHEATHEIAESSYKNEPLILRFEGNDIPRSTIINAIKDYGAKIARGITTGTRWDYNSDELQKLRDGELDPGEANGEIKEDNKETDDSKIKSDDDPDKPTEIDKEKEDNVESDDKPSEIDKEKDDNVEPDDSNKDKGKSEDKEKGDPKSGESSEKDKGKELDEGKGKNESGESSEKDKEKSQSEDKEKDNHEADENSVKGKDSKDSGESSEKDKGKSDDKGIEQGKDYNELDQSSEKGKGKDSEKEKDNNESDESSERYKGKKPKESDESSVNERGTSTGKLHFESDEENYEKHKKYHDESDESSEEVKGKAKGKGKGKYKYHSESDESDENYRPKITSFCYLGPGNHKRPGKYNNRHKPRGSGGGIGHIGNIKNVLQSGVMTNTWYSSKKKAKLNQIMDDSRPKNKKFKTRLCILTKNSEYCIGEGTAPHKKF